MGRKRERHPNKLRLRKISQGGRNSLAGVQLSTFLYMPVNDHSCRPHGAFMSHPFYPSNEKNVHLKVLMTGDSDLPLGVRNCANVSP